MLSLLARASRLGLRSLSRKTTIHQYEYQLVRSFSNSKIFREEKKMPLLKNQHGLLLGHREWMKK